MANFNRPPTSRTPAIALTAKSARLLIEGESYPEDVNGFYAPVFEAIEGYFASGTTQLDVDIKLIYFNSSSARALTNLLDIMDSHAANGAKVTVRWFCDDDDDITREFAEDLAADLESLAISIIA